jgi:hypothetical protein
MARPLRGAGRLNRLRLSGPESRDAIGEMTFMPERNSSVHVRLPRWRLPGSLSNYFRGFMSGNTLGIAVKKLSTESSAPFSSCLATLEKGNATF